MAFAGLSQVESVDLPPSLQTIGERAFIGCSSLRFLTLPENLTSIGIMAFAYCGHVTDIILLTPEAYIAGDAFMGVTALVTYSRLSQWTESRQQGYGGSLIWQQETLRGDANGDGTLNLADVSALFRIISGQVPLSVDQKALDMDGNGYLSLKDVYLLYQIAT
ncbi:MAG: leucine-rich repeat protein [Oscillospiraceae bacterium]|nr:leucine-rich repeat protein [Oscillospiraceae bacterium]